MGVSLGPRAHSRVVSEQRRKRPRPIVSRVEENQRGKVVKAAAVATGLPADDIQEIDQLNVTH